MNRSIRGRRVAGFLASMVVGVVLGPQGGCSKDTEEPKKPAQRAVEREGAEERKVGGSEGPLRVVPQVGPIAPRRVSFSPLAPPRLAVVEADGTVSVWLLDPPGRPRCFAWIRTDAFDAVFSADGATVITAGRDGAISTWTADGRLLRRVPAHSGAVRTLAVSSEIVVSGGADGAVRLWRTDGTARGEPLTGHQGAILSVAVSKQGDIASFGSDQILRIWSVGKDGAYHEATTVNFVQPRFTHLLPNLLALDVNWGWGRQVAFDPKGDVLAVATFDATVRLIHKDGTPVAAPVKGHNGLQVQTVAFAATGSSLVSAGHDGKLQFWLRDGALAGIQIEAHGAPAVSVDQSPDGTLIASAGTDDAVRIWGSAGQKVAELPARSKDRIGAMAISPNAELVAAANGSGEIWLWSREAAVHGAPIRASNRRVSTLAFSSKSDILASSCSGSGVCVWDVEGLVRAGPLVGFGSEVTALAFSPLGDRIVAGNAYAGSLLMWNTAGGGQYPPLEGLRGVASAITFFPDGETVAVASEILRLWKLDGSWRSEGIEGHGGLALAIAVSPRGDHVASSGVDGLVRLWKPDGSPDGAPLAGHVGPVRALAFTEGGELLSGGGDGKLRIWNLGSRQSRVVNVGPPIDIVGRAGNLTWAGTIRREIQFYDADDAPVATMILEPSSAFVVAVDGSYSGEGELLRRLEGFDSNGKTSALPRPSGRSVDAVFASVTRGVPRR